MRNPERITEVLKAVEEVWRRHPDLRLGQLIYGASRKGGVADPFFIEDDRLTEGLRRLDEGLNQLEE